jgi:hypothetical protein
MHHSIVPVVVTEMGLVPVPVLTVGGLKGVRVPVAPMLYWETVSLPSFAT